MSERKLKRCCGPNGCGDFLFPEKNEHHTLYAINAPRICVGLDCEAWVIDERDINDMGHCGYIKL